MVYNTIKLPMSNDDTKQTLDDETNTLPIEYSKESPLITTHKTCSRCKVKKTVDMFQPLTMSLKGKIYYSGKCKECISIYKHNQYLAAHPTAGNKRGPKSQFDDPAIRATVMAVLSTGCSIRAAAIQLGYGYNTLYMAHKNGKFN